MGTEGGDKCVDNVDKLRKKWCGGEKGRIRKRSATSGGGNTLRALRASFEIRRLRRLSRGSADPREHSRSW